MRKTKAASRRKEVKSRGYGRYILKTAGLLLLSVIIWFGIAAAWIQVRQIPFFHCTDVAVKGNSLVVSDELLAGITVPESTSIFECDVVAIADSIKNHPYVATCTIKRKLPAQLQVIIGERIPIAYIMMPTVCLIDTAGVVLPLPKLGIALDLPVITGIKKGTPVYGSVLKTPAITKALAFITGVAGTQMGILERISEIDVSQLDMLKIKTIKPVLTVLIEGSPSVETLRNWHIVEEHSAEGLAEIEYIDLRFKNQIIIKRRS